MTWFDWYTQEIDKQKPWQTFRDRYLCPCCGMPSIGARAEYEICAICFWEDDGQDSDDAADVRGGPNHDYSLEEARSNLKAYLTMYRPSDVAHFKRETAKHDVKQQAIAAYQRAMQSGDEADWQNALRAERELDAFG